MIGHFHLEKQNAPEISNAPTSITQFISSHRISRNTSLPPGLKS